MNFFKKVQYSQNWNIGFCNLSENEFIFHKQIGDIQWLKHPYKDRWFADPFIYSVTGDKIVVFAEELIIKNPKGYLVELIIDKQSKQLIDRYILLELPTHLSYPAYLIHNNKVYVYPENGASGRLNIYEYDAIKHQLVNPICILDEALADSTILQYKENNFYLIATKVPDVQEKAFLYQSNSPTGPFIPVNDEPIQISRHYSRPAGNWFRINRQLYRPAQDCVKGYGNAISIMSIDSLKPYKEHRIFTINPLSFKYNLGTHTINFFHNKNGEDLAVVDGYGYLHPILGRIYYLCRSIIKTFKK